MELVDYKYVFCPVLDREIRLRYGYSREFGGQETKKMLTGCLGAMTCGSSRVDNGKVVEDFSRCPFKSVGMV